MENAKLLGAGVNLNCALTSAQSAEMFPRLGWDKATRLAREGKGQNISILGLSVILQRLHWDGGWLKT